MIENDVLDYDKFQGTGFADGHRIKYVARATYLLSHANAMARQGDSGKETLELEDDHQLEDYVSRKFKKALRAEPHQMLGGNAMPLPNSVSGGSTIGSYVFDPRSALVPYQGAGSSSRMRRSRSLSRR